MSALLFLTYIAFIAAFVATVFNARRAVRVKSRRFFYATSALVAGYAAVVYGLAIAGILDLRDIGPDYLRPWAVLVLASLAGGAIVHWRQE